MKSITDYKTIIVDLDGTLYFQRPVKCAIFLEMLLNFWHFKDFLILKKYRTLYEQGLNERERLSVLPNSTKKIVNEWMLQRPLPYIAKNKDEHLINQLQKAMNNGIIVIVYSDYPVKEKLRALSFTPNQAYSADDIIGMKPNAIGILKVLSQQNISPKNCLVIGDKKEKDGILARNMKADSLILPATYKQRIKLYKKYHLFAKDC